MIHRPNRECPLLFVVPANAAFPKKAVCQTLAPKVPVKDILPAGCAIPLGQVAELMNEQSQSPAK
ncbi:hypothetical protein [Runella slithyformis]|uniref:hypothetical protein n=1 Tax=Runella slithyformis TaxID=106 RepID=UPI0002E3D1B3|nr:hypothetical protein [Runella slithyformis]